MRLARVRAEVWIRFKGLARKKFGRERALIRAEGGHRQGGALHEIGIVSEELEAQSVFSSGQQVAQPLALGK
jgi:hypothetical protein